MYYRLLNPNYREADILYEEQANQLRANGQEVNYSFGYWLDGNTPDEHSPGDMNGKQIFDNILASSPEYQKTYELRKKTNQQIESS